MHPRLRVAQYKLSHIVITVLLLAFYGFVGLAVFLPVLLLDCVLHLPVIFGKYTPFDLI